jgi:hypothetical protein
VTNSNIVIPSEYISLSLVPGVKPERTSGAHQRISPISPCLCSEGDVKWKDREKSNRRADGGWVGAIRMFEPRMSAWMISFE